MNMDNRVYVESFTLAFASGRPGLFPVGPALGQSVTPVNSDHKTKAAPG